MASLERRNGSKLDASEGDGGYRVSGYAAVFNSDANIGGAFIERIAPGAFADAVGRDDVVFLIEHDGLPLARTRSGTLTLTEDDHGLRVETVLDPSDPDVASIIPKMRRGDLDKMSFAFTPTREEWTDGDMPTRTIKEAALFDVSIVTTPAYESTEIGLRSYKATRKSNAAVKARISCKLKLADISG